LKEVVAMIEDAHAAVSADFFITPDDEVSAEDCDVM
jgi:hypothetical protein